MKKRLLDLQAKAKAIVDRMKAADAAGDQAAFDAAQAELAPISAEITRVKALMQAEETAAPEPQNLATAQGAPGAPVSSNECIHAFCECVRAGAAGDRTRYLQNADIVHRAVKNEGMTEGTPADGGLIVPSDIQTMIREQMRALNPLSELFTVETVSTNTGSRVRDTAPTNGFTKVAEMGTISKDDKPAFTKVEFTVEDYALIVPVSNDLLSDTDQNLLAYLSRWLGKKAVITENILDPDYANAASIDVEAQRAAWVASGKAEAADWDDDTVKATPYKRTVYLAGNVKILGSMTDLIFPINLF